MAFFDTVQLTAPVPFLLFRFAECSPARGLFMHQLLLHLVPCAAVRTFSSPFRRLISAGHTFKYIFRFSHQALRSEERRVGKECRSRWSRYQSKKKEDAEDESR